METISFSIELPDNKLLTFTNETYGLIANGIEYISGEDGILIYDKTKNVRSFEVKCQMSSNTSALVPALRILEIPINPYFTEREVLESQNDITFYLKPSKLAAFYNRFSTDDVELKNREPIIRQAVEFLINNPLMEDFLAEETLHKLNEPCMLLGFYEGFPIFDGKQGLPKLLCRLGIHIGNESVLISSPLDKYQQDIDELADFIEQLTGLKGTRKKNRVQFEKDEKILKELKLVQ